SARIRPLGPQGLLGAPQQALAGHRLMRAYRRGWLAAIAAAALGAGDAHANDSLGELIRTGQRAAALAAIEAGADVNAAEGDGTTPLHWAVYRIDPELVDALLARGANPSAMSLYGSTPLAEAVNIANTELVAKLLEAGADPEAPNQDGQT